MTGQLGSARRRTGPAKKQIVSRLRIRPRFGRKDHASLAKTEGESSYQSPKPDAHDLKTAPLPKHPPIAHLVFGSYVAAGVFDLLSVLPAGFIPGRDLYQAATYLLILATLALVFAAATGFRDRAKWTPSGSPTQRLANMHAAAMTAVGVLAAFDITLRSYVYPSATQAPLGSPADDCSPVRAHRSRRSPGRCPRLSAWHRHGSQLQGRAEPTDLSRCARPTAGPAPPVWSLDCLQLHSPESTAAT
jgi:uncharacterized membrane protein